MEMEFFIKSNKLIEIVSKFVNIIDALPLHESLSNLVFIAKNKELNVFGTNLDTGLNIFTESVNIVSEGKLLISYVTIKNIVQECKISGIFHFCVKKNECYIKYRSTVWKTLILNQDYYFNLLDLNYTEKEYKIKKPEFLDLLKRMKFGISKDFNNRSLSQLQINSNFGICGNGFRFLMLKSKLNLNVLIPFEAIDSLIDILKDSNIKDFCIIDTKKYLFIKINIKDLYFYRKTNVNFIDINEILSTTNNLDFNIVLSRYDMLNSLKRIKVFVNDSVRLIGNKNKLVIKTVSNSNEAKELINVQGNYSIDLILNFNILLNSIINLKSKDNIVIRFDENLNHPIIIDDLNGLRIILFKTKVIR